MSITYLFSMNWSHCNKFLHPPERHKIPEPTRKAGLVVIMPRFIPGTLYLSLRVCRGFLTHSSWNYLPGFAYLFLFQQLFTEGLLYAKCCSWLGGYKINKAQSFPSRPLQSSRGDRELKRQLQYRRCNELWIMGITVYVCLPLAPLGNSSLTPLV